MENEAKYAQIVVKIPHDNRAWCRPIMWPNPPKRRPSVGESPVYYHDGMIAEDEETKWRERCRLKPLP